MQSWKGKYANATYTKCNGNAVKVYLLVLAHGCSSLCRGSFSLYGNSSSLFSLGVLTVSGDDDVDDASFFLRHVPRGFGLFLPGVGDLIPGYPKEEVTSLARPNGSLVPPRPSAHVPLGPALPRPTAEG